MKSNVRGWTLDILRIVQSFGKREFGLAEVYAFEHELSRAHPDNRHIQPKIRQQLQILRDLRFVEFLGGGRYRAV
jgi:type II restriction enzyme